MTLVWSVIIAMAVALVFFSLLVVGLLRSHAEILRRLDSLGVRLDAEEQGPAPVTLSTRSEPEEAAPQIVGITPDSEPLVVSPVLGSDHTLLAFLSTTCSSCTMFWEYFTSPYVEIDGRRFRVVVVTLGEDEESPTRAQALMQGTVQTVMSSGAWQAYNAPGAPYFALVDPHDGMVVGEGTAPTVDALEGFLRDSLGDRSWDRARVSDRTDRDREQMVDEELRRAGIHPGDPRLYPGKEISSDD